MIVQFGGQTPLNLSRALYNAGVPIIGTSVDTIEDAEDREKFKDLLNRLGLKQPANGIARTMAQAKTEAAKIGYPVLVRPSFVLGGRAMVICYDASQVEMFVREAFIVAQGQPVLIDRFLEDATEVDVDAIGDGRDVIVAGVMEHIEEAGVHSGDSACAIPPYSLPGPVVDEIRKATRDLAQALRVKGLMNVQYAVKREDGRPVVYVLEVNPARQPHGAVRVQGDGHAGGQDCRQGDGGRDAFRAGHLPRADPQPRVGQGERVPLCQVCRRGHHPRTGDEIHRGSDGDQRPLLHRLCQESDRRGHRAALQRQNLHQRCRPRQGRGGGIGATPGEAGLRAAGHPRHGPAIGRGGHQGRSG